jgi:hypothetical protein
MNLREIHSNETKQFIFNCIVLGWLCIFMLLHMQKNLKINTYSRLPHFQLALVIDHHLHHRCHYHHIFIIFIIIVFIIVIWQLWRDGIKVFLIGVSATYVGLLGIKLMFNFRNIVITTRMGLRDDCLGAMTSFIPPRLHSDSN